jgi:uncharacterized protein (DUF1778 family)
MPTTTRRSKTKPVGTKAANLMVRVDPAAKSVIVRAATIRGISTSDYVRLIVVAQARREVDEARTRTIVLSPEEQLTFWKALHEPVQLTQRQQELARLMRGE